MWARFPPLRITRRAPPNFSSSSVNFRTKRRLRSSAIQPEIAASTASARGALAAFRRAFSCERDPSLLPSPQQMPGEDHPRDGASPECRATPPRYPRHPLRRGPVSQGGFPRYPRWPPLQFRVSVRPDPSLPTEFLIPSSNLAVRSRVGGKDPATHRSSSWRNSDGQPAVIGVVCSSRRKTNSLVEAGTKGRESMVPERTKMEIMVPVK